MKDWNSVKNKQFDASGIDNPQDWLWYLHISGIYYPLKLKEK